jgi:hypothetical protein
MINQVYLQNPTPLTLPEGFCPASFGGGQSHTFVLGQDGTLLLCGDNRNSQLGFVVQFIDKLTEFPAVKFRCPRRSEAWRVGRWIFLGREDGGSTFSVLPVEIIFHFVTVLV